MNYPIFKLLHKNFVQSLRTDTVNPCLLPWQLFYYDQYKENQAQFPFRSNTIQTFKCGLEQ